MQKLLLVVIAILALAAPAHAGPVAAAFAVFKAAITSSAIATALARIAIGIGSSLLSSAIAKSAAQRPKISVQFEVDFGDDTPLKFVVGDYATSGNQKYVGSWGRNHRYVTEVLEISSLPQPGAISVWADDEVADIRWTQAEMVDGHLMGYPVKNFSEGVGTLVERDRCWIKYVDGTQTAADAFVTSRFSADPDYPWTAEMIGSGKPYAVVTYYYDPESMTARPSPASVRRSPSKARRTRRRCHRERLRTPMRRGSKTTAAAGIPWRDRPSPSG